MFEGNFSFVENQIFFGGNFVPIFFIQDSIVVQLSRTMFPNFKWTGLGLSIQDFIVVQLSRTMFPNFKWTGLGLSI